MSGVGEYPRSPTVAVAFPAATAGAWRDRLEAATRNYFPALNYVACSNVEELQRAVPDILVGHETDFVAEYLSGCPERLRWVQFMSAGVDRAMAAVGRRPVPYKISNVRGIHAEGMREYVLATFLAHTKRLHHWEEAKQARVWLPEPLETVAGQRALIVGAGAIGTAVAEGCRALGMGVTGVSSTGLPRAAFDSMCTLAELPAELHMSDLIVLSLPLTPATVGLFDSKMFAACRHGSFLVNLSRGALIEETALAEALFSGKLGGAALDAFNEEPLPKTSALWQIPNLLITPHVAGRSRNGWARGAEIFLENLRRHFDGVELLTEVDPSRGY